ncbi:MAG TPA: ankyrin repeat domain-containing protein [Vicinamibacterales bacterium]|nr:ankyrin repeat domain-containing protein [Vicinamibacterales bacterium]
MRRLIASLGLIVAISAGLNAAIADSPIAAAAQNGDREAVRALLKKGLDVNGAQGDGSTALHWAAIKGDAEMARMLIYAGANVRATTRIGAYTPLYLAAKGGYADVVAVLLAGGADAKAVTSNGTTPLMIAAAAGDTRSITSLIENGADINAKDGAKGETPLIFAAGFNRTDAVKLLLARGADHKVTTKVVDLFALTAPEEEAMLRGAGGNAPPGARPAANRPADVAGATRAYRYNELISTQGGLSALLFAARQGYTDTAKALLDGGADVNQLNAGDRTSPLLMSIINGHFDLSLMLLERGANPNAPAFNGVAPLFAVLNLQWAPKSLYPSPKAYQQQKTTYLELMQALIAKGADPNARVGRKVWYQAYNSDYAGFDEVGATPFFRAAYASDVAAMKLLVAAGADSHLGTMKPAGRPFTGEGTRQIQDTSGVPPVPYGGPAILPIHAATGVGYGEGFAANSHRYAPTGFMPAIKYLVEETGADVNAADHEGNTPLHLCASRGDNECIKYLVAKGADVMRVNREGNTTVDMANGPVQRTQPYPETIKLLEGLGAKNNHRCITC